MGVDTDRHRLPPNTPYTLTLLGPDAPFDFAHVSSVACVPLLPDGRVLVVELLDRGPDIPGGHVRGSEHRFEQTLAREVMEEACVTVVDPRLVEVIRSDSPGRTPLHMLVYAARVDEQHAFTPDEASERRAMDPEDFLAAYRGDGALMRSCVTRALTAFE